MVGNLAFTRISDNRNATICSIFNELSERTSIGILNMPALHITVRGICICAARLTVITKGKYFSPKCEWLSAVVVIALYILHFIVNLFSAILFSRMHYNFLIFVYFICR